jgi:hypothetical protein
LTAFQLSTRKPGRQAFLISAIFRRPQNRLRGFKAEKIPQAEKVYQDGSEKSKIRPMIKRRSSTAPSNPSTMRSRADRFLSDERFLGGINS